MIFKGSIALEMGNRKTLYINQLALSISIILGNFYRHSWHGKQGDPEEAAELRGQLKAQK